MGIYVSDDIHEQEIKGMLIMFLHGSASVPACEQDLTFPSDRHCYEICVILLLKEIGKTGIIKSSSKKLRDEISHAISIEEVLNIYTQNQKDFKHYHLVNAFKKVGKIGNAAISQVNEFSLKQSIFVLDALAKLPVPPTSRVVQSHLQISIQNMFNVLSVAADHPSIHDITVQKILVAIKRRKQEITDKYIVQHSLLILLKLRKNKISEELIEMLIDRYIRLLPEVNISGTTALLITCLRKRIFNIKLFDAISANAIENDLGFRELQNYIAVFSELKYFNASILKAFCKEVSKNESEVIGAQSLSILQIMKYFNSYDSVFAGYHDVFDILCSNESVLSKLKESSPLSYIKLLCYFLSLKFHPMNMMDNVFKSSYIHSIIEDKSITSGETTCEFQKREGQIISNFPPTPQGFMNNLKNTEKVSKSYLNSSLVEYIGGCEFLISDLWTKSGIHIEHLVAFRNRNDMVKLTKSNTDHNEMLKSEHDICFVEDLVFPPGTKVVAIVVAEKEIMKNVTHNHMINSKMEALQMLGCSTALTVKMARLKGLGLGHVTRKEGIECLSLQGRINGKRSRGRPRFKYLDRVKEIVKEIMESDKCTISQLYAYIRDKEYRRFLLQTTASRFVDMVHMITKPVIRQREFKAGWRFESELEIVASKTNIKQISGDERKVKLNVSFRKMMNKLICVHKCIKDHDSFKLNDFEAILDIFEDEEDIENQRSCNELEHGADVNGSSIVQACNACV
ncbi:hypothetical protein GQR58_003870 [Nymphon striatum]|nr:hypothetical protein GQR58_003870 [Nymphon striatum]